MIIEVLRRSIIGIAIGALVTFVALTILVIFSIESTVIEIWRHFLSSMLMGVYFSLASLIFESERGSLLKQTIIHFVLSLIVISIVSIYAGWVPFTLWSLIIGLGIFLLTYFIMWIGIYTYYKKLEKSMNESIEKR
ncbi:DUF3021 domain-containing protein [Gracilibacillus dipsosauri]|uniref:DUF3021 domain-containing protein n=1 Tax=Gracilibacillus dipsosauri TaxID=178340 RepID=A0A317KTU7_9BACI|nr:DUF3021 domain-containing protein [Gracilibacillus dipsosauri]PWU66952.1 DUF3021 domain-containing protein [Gracilibacillus dipsosauri]